MVIPLAQYWRRPPLADQSIALIGVALIIVSVTFYRKDIPVPGYYALLPTVGAACLLLSGANCATYIARFLSLRPVVYIGAISYPLYLVHWPIAVFSGLLVPDPPTDLNLMMFGLSIVIAALIYHFVEYPIRAKRWLSAGPKLLMGYGAGLAVTVSFLALVFTTDGLPQRFPSNVVRLAAYADDKPPPLTECENADGAKSGLQRCRIGAKGVTPTWFVYGDSHAWAAHSTFDQWLKSRGEAGLFAFRHACVPINGAHTFGDNDACFRFNRGVTRIIENSPDLMNIVLVSIWLEAGALSTSTKSIANKAESLKLFARYFSSTIEHLNELGRRVYVWEPVPGGKDNVPRGLARAALSGRPENLMRSLADYHSMYSFFFQMLTANRGRIYATFSPSQFLCGSGACRVEVDGRPLYADGNHMSNSTADIWSKVLAAPVLGTNSVVR